MRYEPNCCQASLSSPLDGMQAYGKALVSSTHKETATLAHGHEGPTRGHAEAIRSRHQSRSSKAGKALTTFPHGVCFFLYDKGQGAWCLGGHGTPSYGLYHELLRPHELAVARWCVTDGRRGSTWWVRVRSQEGFEVKVPVRVLELYPYTQNNHDPVQALYSLPGRCTP